MRATMTIFATALVGALLASATPALGQGRPHQPNGPPADVPRGHPTRAAVPELDPAAAGAVVALIGAGTVLVVRRRKK